jgi:hypothetical protein
MENETRAELHSRFVKALNVSFVVMENHYNRYTNNLKMDVVKKNFG